MTKITFAGREDTIQTRGEGMSYRKGELGLYDCRERSAGRKLFLVFIAGLMCGVMLIVGLFLIVSGN